MKKIYKKVIALGMGLSFILNVNAQIVTENFDDVEGLFTTGGWARQNLSSPLGAGVWTQGDPANFNSYNGATDSYAWVGYQSTTGANIISNWMFSPERTYTNGDMITFYTRCNGNFPDRMEVRFSANGASVDAGTTNTSVGDFTTLLLTINDNLTAVDYPTVWTQYSITISGLATPTSGRIAFRYNMADGGPSGNNSDEIGIDEFSYIPVGTNVVDVTASAPLMHEYTSMPFSQVTPFAIGATLSNIGTTTIADATLKADVFLVPDFTTPVQTYSVQTSLTASTNTVVAFGNYTPTAAGVYYVEYTSSGTGQIVGSSDTTYSVVNVDPYMFARDNGTITQRIGIGAGPTSYLGQKITISNTVNIDSVIVGFSKPGTDATAGDGVGDSTKIAIFSMSGGLPTTQIGMSNSYVFTIADTSASITPTFNITNMAGASLSLAPGDYLVAATEYNTNFGLLFSDNVFTNNSMFVQITGGAWSPLEAYGAAFSKVPYIRSFVSVAPVSIKETVASNLVSIFPNPNAGVFTVKATENNSSVAVYSIIGENVYSAKLAKGNNSIDLTNLAAGSYIVKVNNGGTLVTKRVVINK